MLEGVFVLCGGADGKDDFGLLQVFAHGSLGSGLGNMSRNDARGWVNNVDFQSFLLKWGKPGPHFLEAIAVFAEMGEMNGLQSAGAIEVFEQLVCGIVGEVAVPSADALFGGPWAFCILFEEFFVIVGLDDKGLDLTEVDFYMLGNISEVGDPGKAAGSLK